MKYRIPRKLKKKIPKDTLYCYKSTSNMIYEEGQLPYFKIKQCPFSTYIKIKDMNPVPNWVDQEYLDEFGELETNWCRLVKGQIEDQCKSCGEGYGRI